MKTATIHKLEVLKRKLGKELTTSNIQSKYKIPKSRKKDINSTMSSLIGLYNKIERDLLNLKDENQVKEVEISKNESTYSKKVLQSVKELKGLADRAQKLETKAKETSGLKSMDRLFADPKSTLKYFSSTEKRELLKGIKDKSQGLGGCLDYLNEQEIELEAKIAQMQKNKAKMDLSLKKQRKIIRQSAKVKKNCKMMEAKISELDTELTRIKYSKSRTKGMQRPKRELNQARAKHYASNVVKNNLTARYAKILKSNKSQKSRLENARSELGEVNQLCEALETALKQLRSDNTRMEAKLKEVEKIDDQIAIESRKHKYLTMRHNMLRKCFGEPPSQLVSILDDSVLKSISGSTRAMLETFNENRELIETTSEDKNCQNRQNDGVRLHDEEGLNSGNRSGSGLEVVDLDSGEGSLGGFLTHINSKNTLKVQSVFSNEFHHPSSLNYSKGMKDQPTGFFDTFNMPEKSLESNESDQESRNRETIILIEFPQKQPNPAKKIKNEVPGVNEAHNELPAGLKTDFLDFEKKYNTSTSKATTVNPGPNSDLKRSPLSMRSQKMHGFRTPIAQTGSGASRSSNQLQDGNMSDMFHQTAMKEYDTLQSTEYDLDIQSDIINRFLTTKNHMENPETDLKAFKAFKSKDRSLRVRSYTERLRGGVVNSFASSGGVDLVCLRRNKYNSEIGADRGDEQQV